MLLPLPQLRILRLSVAPNFLDILDLKLYRSITAGLPALEELSLGHAEFYANYSRYEQGAFYERTLKTNVKYKFVCVFTRALNTPVLFRSYIHETKVQRISASDCAIWEAPRATSAAATFFDAIKIGNQTYIDGATGHNNPIDACIVKIGEGMPKLKNFGENLEEALKDIATETETTQERFYKEFERRGLADHYFRFNVQHGLDDVGLQEHLKVDVIEAAMERYLELPEVEKNVKALLNSKASGNAGSGKTILSSTVIDEIERLNLGRLAFFYFSYSSPEIQDNKNLLSSLLTHFPSLIQKSSTSENIQD
ncbi:hypothetical protein G7Y89_g5515 [Cudoniella acicularis]|uniref:PNPLA domain-containing protein n=1 Tax=Cudoniella acicularis TaxID=354080 RepID=A0A8H4RNQ9_9HELO|nr:hypothetical protein G7Y89_g5515 [Cudoniella acicularis]